jgi:D-arabinose 1-dehydrogenase-like Zn-dependent alcohol dehydrogenase
MIPGHETAGIVEAVGDENSTFKAGQFFLLINIIIKNLFQGGRSCHANFFAPGNF